MWPPAIPTSQPLISSYYLDDITSNLPHSLSNMLSFCFENVAHNKELWASAGSHHISSHLQFTSSDPHCSLPACSFREYLWHLSFLGACIMVSGDGSHPLGPSSVQNKQVLSKKRVVRGICDSESEIYSKPGALDKWHTIFGSDFPSSHSVPGSHTHACMWRSVVNLRS